MEPEHRKYPLGYEILFPESVIQGKGADTNIGKFTLTIMDYLDRTDIEWADGYPHIQIFQAGHTEPFVAISLTREGIAGLTEEGLTIYLKSRLEKELAALEQPADA